MNRTKRVIIIGLLVAMGLILHFVESLIPMTAIVPGAKLGLANIVTLVGLVLFGLSASIQIQVLRILLGSLFAGSFLTLSFYLSISGGVLSLITMFLAYYFFNDKFSLVGISIIGAVFHNLGQIIMAYIIIANPGIFFYLPYLVLLAIPTGIGVGLVSYFTVNYLPGRIVKGG